MFLRFTHENQKAQKYLLGGIEKTIETKEAALLVRVPHILKELFDEDILEEEVILEWAKKVRTEVYFLLQFMFLMHPILLL